MTGDLNTGVTINVNLYNDALWVMIMLEIKTLIKHLQKQMQPLLLMNK
jgi:hypothetical protein